MRKTLLPGTNHLVAALLYMLSLLALTPHSLAQNTSYKMAKYNKQIHHLISSRQNLPYEFVKLRRFYSEIDDYEPDGLSIIEEMNAIAPDIKPHSTATNDIIIFDRFKRLMLTHMGNITIVENAARLARLYPGILNQAQLDYILAGLRESLTLSGDGQSKRTAFDLYTLGEEAALLEALNVRLQYKAIKKEDLLTYAVYRTQNKETGQERTVYANISAYADILQTRLEEKDKKAAPIEGR